MFELLIIAVVLLLVFGASKLRRAGSDLGTAVKGFRKAVQARPTAHPTHTEPDAEFPEVLDARSRGGGKPGA